jgi:hypothetical protein
MKWYEKLLRWGFCANYWLWFHILIGGLIAKILNIWLSDWLSILIVLMVAIVWEIMFEYWIEYKHDKKTIEQIYGNMERYIYDSVGDILGAVICGIIVAI